MNPRTQSIETASFSSKIRLYILLVVGFYLFISIIGIPFLLFWFAGLGQLFSRRYHENLRCKLTDRNLNYRKGVLFRVEKTIPLENIQDLTFIENPILNALELRILKIETAGHSNPQGSDMKLIGIVDAGAFKEKVLLQREILTSGRRSTTAIHGGAEGPAEEGMMDILKEIRDILSDIRKNKGP
jgi:putative membrane protein